MSIKADIAEMTIKDIEKVVSRTEALYGTIDTVICCAAISIPKLFLSTDFKEYEHHMNLNFFGVAKFVHVVAKRWVNQRKKGRFVLIGDPIASHYVMPAMSAYSCSKSALE